jgi:hypothetical protein
VQWGRWDLEDLLCFLVGGSMHDASVSNREESAETQMQAVNARSAIKLKEPGGRAHMPNGGVATHLSETPMTGTVHLTTTSIWASSSPPSSDWLSLLHAAETRQGRSEGAAAAASIVLFIVSHQ